MLPGEVVGQILLWATAFEIAGMGPVHDGFPCSGWILMLVSGVRMCGGMNLVRWFCVVYWFVVVCGGFV